MVRLTQSLAMGVGASGAMTDVSSYVDLVAGVDRSWGRKSDFDVVPPGTFSFTLDNADGRFTPDNPSSALATRVTEGMQVCWKLDNGSQSRLVAGTIQSIEPGFPSGESAWAQVRVTCDDMLGNAARASLNYLPDDVVHRASPYLWWPLDDVTANYSVSDVTGLGAPMYVIGAGPATPNVPGVPGAGPSTQVRVATDSAGNSSSFRTVYDNSTVVAVPAIAYATSATRSFWGVWITPEVISGANAFLQVNFTSFPQTSGNDAFLIGCVDGSARFASNPISISGATLPLGVAHHFMVELYQETTSGTTSLKAVPYLDGVAFAAVQTLGSYTGSAATAAQMTPALISLAVASLSATLSSACFSNLTVTATKAEQFAAASTSASSRLTAIANAVPEITLGTLPTLASAPLDYAEEGDQAALDAINDIVSVEQGSVYTATSGTLTAPTQTIKIRERDRPTAVTYTFNAETEANGATDFVRDISNMVSEITVNSANASATYKDSTLFARVGSKDTSESVPIQDRTNLYTWGTDYVARGSQVKVRPDSITIDALTTPTDRTADLLALIPQDRIQVSGLPSTQLGFSTTDGWLLGADEHHSLTEHSWRMYLQPVLPRPAIYDTDVFGAGGNLTLTSGCTNSATSISVTSSDGTLLSTTGGDYPRTFRLENEVITVSAVSGASSPQTITATRGSTDPVTGLATTAVSHAAAVVLEVADPAYLAF